MFTEQPVVVAMLIMKFTTNINYEFHSNIDYKLH